MGRLILVLWLYPLLEFAWMVIGLSRARWGSHHHRGSGATEAIIQITTVGNYETVNEIIKAVREYNLPFPYKFWVVVEPGVDNHYVDADEVIVVPEDFECFAAYKARAQEYSRRLRQLRGLDRHDVKIVMLDDDSLPTAKYFVDVYEADYDVCEGVLTPRRGYGRFLTHCDDLRTFSCLVVCSFWQGFGHPIWIHGEGLCLRGSAEAKVTWNFPVIASEDLTVGQMARHPPAGLANAAGESRSAATEASLWGLMESATIRRLVEFGVGLERSGGQRPIYVPRQGRAPNTGG